MTDGYDDGVQTPGELEVTHSDELEVIHAHDAADSAAAVSGPLPDARTALEAVLLVVDEPVAEVVLAQVLERPTEEIGQMLHALAAEYDEQGRGFELRNVSSGWRLYTRESCAPYVERFVRDGQQARLTQAALETLAVVAYRQPVVRSRIAGIRGVNVDAVMRTLVTRGLVTEVGTERESGAILYGTTAYFLERLGLDQLDDLPPLSDYLPDPYALDEDDVSTST
jgi:segregation and condensation protein B